MKIRISSGGQSPRDWCDIDLSTALDGLPGTDEPVDRILVDRALEYVHPELLSPVLDAWREHPHVSTRTLMAVVGSDLLRGQRLLLRGVIAQDELDRARTSAGPHRHSGVELYTALREAGWGAALPYNIRLLALDGWPITDLSPCQSGALCRPTR